jgi:heme/copper-type cytochrome/quinol oxidase subunit 1
MYIIARTRVHLCHPLSRKRRIVRILGKVKGRSYWTADPGKVVYFPAACMDSSQRTTIFLLFPPLEKQWYRGNNEILLAMGT